MDKDQCHVQTLRILYLHGILLPWGLFIAKKRVLKRASQWLLKQTIISSSSQDISHLVFSDLLCYETPKRERSSCAFEYLIQNLKSYNGIKI